MNKTLYLTTLFLLCLIGESVNSYDTIIFIATGIVFFQLILHITKSSIILDVISLYSCILYFVGPYLGYKFFNQGSKITVMYDFVMPIPKETYFHYVFPAIMLFIIGLHLFRKSNESTQLKLITQELENIADNKNGYSLVLLGVVSFYILPYTPIFLKYVVTICFLMTFAGFMILYFSKKTSKLKFIIQVFIIVWIFYYGIKTTMFTIVFYMGVTMAGILALKIKISFLKKLLLVFLFAIFTISLQFVKTNYRTLIRKGVEKDLEISKFINIFYSTLTNISEVTDIKNVFPLHLRFNNGFYLAKVMHRMPRLVPFDGGERVFQTILASFVPRLFWPDKPQAGGIYNMKYYAGIKVTHTVNIGPIGEAYGSFGQTGGVIYMLLFGVLLGLAHRIFISLSFKKPLIFIYMPMIFYETLFCMENDTMQALNSLIKMSLFLFIFLSIFPQLYNSRSKYLSIII